MKPLDFYYQTPVREWPLASRAFYCFAGFVVFVVSKLLFRWTVADADAFLQAAKGAYSLKHGGVVVICNHVSVVEPPLLVSFAWCHRFRLRPLHKKELEKNHLLSWLFSRMGGIPVARGEEDVKLIRRSVKLLQKGESVLVFPEGTRVKANEQVAFHRGFSLIAKLAKTDVYPAAVVGALQIKPQGSRLPRPHKVRFIFGEPLITAEFVETYKKQATEAMDEAAEEAVLKLKETLRSRYPRLI